MASRTPNVAEAGEDSSEEQAADIRAATTDPLTMSDSSAAPVGDGNDEFPVPFARFASTLHHTSDEVWLTHLRINHGRENHKPSEWRDLLDGHRHHPAHPGV